jgi:hypothetical protein
VATSWLIHSPQTLDDRVVRRVPEEIVVLQDFLQLSVVMGTLFIEIFGLPGHLITYVEGQVMMLQLTKALGVVVEVRGQNQPYPPAADKGRTQLKPRVSTALENKTVGPGVRPPDLGE